jgi:hypothetical protein
LQSIEAGCSSIETTCNFVSIACSFVPIACSSISIDWSFVPIACSSISIACSFVPIDCFSISIDCTSIPIDCFLISIDCTFIPIDCFSISIDGSFVPIVCFSISIVCFSISIDCTSISVDGSFASIVCHFVTTGGQVSSIAPTFVREEAAPGGEKLLLATPVAFSSLRNVTSIWNEEKHVMTTNKQTTTPRTIATLDLPLKVGALINYAQAIVKSVTDNPHIPNPTPTIAALNTAIAALVADENAALTRVKGAIVQRNAAKKTLVQLLELLKANVQSLADADPDNAPTIIESAGIGIRKTAVRKPRVFAATQGTVSGSAKLLAPSAGPRSSYEWEVSSDGGKTWVTAPPSIQAKTSVQGLASGTTVQFRYRAVTPKTGAGDWSAAVSLLVQ